MPQGTPQAAVLLVFPPQAQPVCDTTRMAYMVRPYQVDYFSQHEWAETPPQMLHPLLVRTLQATNRFKAVLAPPFSGRHAYALRTQVLELLQDFTVEPPTLRLSLRLELSDDAASRVVATKDIALREPMRDKAPTPGSWRPTTMPRRRCAKPRYSCWKKCVERLRIGATQHLLQGRVLDHEVVPQRGADMPMRQANRQERGPERPAPCDTGSA